MRVSQEKQQTIKGSLADLLGKAQGKQCTWSYQGEGADSSGTVYVGKNKMYGESQMEVQTGEGAETMRMKMINDGEYFYQWSEETGQGSKMSLAEMEKWQEQGQEQASAQEQARMRNMQQEYEYKCSNWKVDESKFELPKNIQFTDLTKMMQETQQQVEQMRQDACAMCEQLPEGEAKQQCLQACQ